MIAAGARRAVASAALAASRRSCRTPNNAKPADMSPPVTGYLLRSLSSAVSAKGEIVTFLGLNNVADNPGAVKRKRRVGRGIGSSKGKTSGRGHKGQKARSGGSIHPTFEGGQTKFYKRIPKRGFNNKVHAQPMVPINVGTLQDYVDMGRLVPPKNNEPPLTMKDLIEAGITKASSIKHGMKLLGDGAERVRTPLRIEISRASSGAIDAIENVGGEVTTVHYNRLALRALLKPHKFDILPKRASPPPKLMTYYTSWENRGYLCPEVQLRKLRGASSSVRGDSSDRVERAAKEKMANVTSEEDENKQ